VIESLRYVRVKKSEEKTFPFFASKKPKIEKQLQK